MTDIVTPAIIVLVGMYWFFPKTWANMIDGLSNRGKEVTKPAPAPGGRRRDKRGRWMR